MTDQIAPMGPTHDNYKRLELPAGLQLVPCPVCAADAELWQFSESSTDPTSKAVMCSRGEPIGPRAGVVEGCLLFMAPNDFYQPTMREAVRFWNDFARALTQIQRAGRWERANALRKGGSA